MPLQDNGELVHNPDGGVVRVYGNIAEKYKQEWAAFNASACKHTETQTRERSIADGGIQCRPQCTTCGLAIGNSIKKTTGLPKWDDGLNDRYEVDRKKKQESLCRKFIELQEAENRKLESKSEDWRKQYASYRRTPAWQSKRLKVIERAGGKCEGCLDAPAILVHHLDYSNIGDELLFQLVALCEACHQKTHPEHHEPVFYDVDYIPCAQCRWGDGGITCGRTGEPASKALSADGECGPTWSAYEGLK